MKIVLLLLVLLLLQSCYVDDNNQPEQAGPVAIAPKIVATPIPILTPKAVVKEPEVVLVVGETQVGTIKNVKPDESYEVKVRGIIGTPNFSDPYLKEIPCSWDEKLGLMGRYSFFKTPMVNKEGNCIASIRDFLGYTKREFLIPKDHIELPLKIKGIESPIPIKPEEVEPPNHATWNLKVTEEMVAPDGTLTFEPILKDEISEKIQVGVIEFVGDLENKFNITAKGDYAEPKLMHVGDIQGFELKVSKILK